MKEKILKLVTVISLIITLTSLNVIFLSYNVVMALADGLEAQNNDTNIANVKFDAYFKTEGGNTYYKQSNISDEQYLYINVNVVDKGSLENSKIKINDANFKIKDVAISNAFIKNINNETNEIELNSVIYNNNVEVEIPIEFNKKDNINAEYFSKESSISIEGTYREEESEQQLQGNKTVEIDWTDNTEITLSQNIEKCIDLVENGILVQQQVISKLENKNLPREEETLKIQVPQINGILASNVKVLLNGKKIDDTYIQYNQESGELKVNQQNLYDESGNVEWNSNDNIYKIIYIYDKKAKENLEKIKISVELNTKLFTKENIQKNDEQEVQLELKGNIVSITKNVTNEVYKGYLYANSTNETLYTEDNNIEISNAQTVESIKASTNNSYFTNDNNDQYDANNIILYKQTTINKDRLLELFGEDGYINIKDEAGNIVRTINNQTEVDDNGNVTIIYEQPLKGIIIETSKPVEEGQFTIQNTKYIQGDTGYSKNTLKTVTKLNTNEVVETNLGIDMTESMINLLDTKTEATLEMNTTNLSTLQKNEDVQFNITLKTALEKYDLFKNPVIELVLPAGISNITVKSINKMYADELSVEYARLLDGNNGEKIIRIVLIGEQKDYAKEVNEASIVINADIEFDILTASQKSAVSMTYTNENGNDDSYSTSVDVNIESKAGMMMYSGLSGYNTAGEFIYTIDDNVPVGVLDLDASSRTAQLKTAVINNYGEDVNNVTVIGRIPSNGVHDGTIDTTLTQGIITNLEGVKILYSQSQAASAEDEGWTEDYTNAKSYKITLDNMTAGQVIKIQYGFVIPEKIGYGQSIFGQTTMTYTYAGNPNTQSSAIGAKTESLITNNIVALQSTTRTNEDGLDIAISTVSGGSELEEGDSVYEGQNIAYTIQITNNTGTDLTNMNVKATQTNGNIYDLIEEEGFDPAVGGDTHKMYHRYGELDTNIKEFDAIESLANGESVILQYEVVVLEINEETARTSGNILINVDGLDEISTDTISNEIKQSELKLTIQNSRYEEETLYTGTNMHMNLTIENISGNSLKNLKGKIQLPEGTRCEDSEKLVCDEREINGETADYDENTITNLSYNNEDNVFTFEIPNMEAQEKLVIMLYFVVDEFQDADKDFTFMYQMNAENTYVSNLAMISVINTERDVTIEQNASIDDNTILGNEDIFDIMIRINNNENQDLFFGVNDVLPEGLTVIGGKMTYLGEETEIPIFTDAEQVEEDSKKFNFFDNTLTGEQYIEGKASLEIVISIQVNSEYVSDNIVTNTVSVIYGEEDEKGYYKYKWSNSIEENKDYQIKLLSEEVKESDVEINQVGDPGDNAEVINNQEIKYTVTIRNRRNYEIEANIYDYLPEGIVAESVLLDGTQLDAGNVIVEGYTIEGKETIVLEISGYIDNTRVSSGEITNNLTVTTIAGSTTSNNITYTILEEGTEPENPDNPDPDNPDIPDPDNPENPDIPSGVGSYTISGIAWADDNKNGKRDSNENTLSGIGVKVINVDEGTYVDNINVRTSQNGDYQINVNPGNYILVFEYNTELYRLTEYKKDGVLESENSDVISKNVTVNGVNSILGATDTISVTSSNVENIDIGLIQASTFDLELNKYISQIVVETNKTTSSYTYSDTTLAKVEIPSRELNDATITIRYTIQVTNTGDTAGYVQNIVDYVPSDLEFDLELNSDWHQSNDYLYSSSLSNTAILPGQTRNIDLVLVKRVTDSNTGTIINVAELQTTSNTLGLRDIDSTPGNNNSSEDDYGKAEIIISIGTGLIILYISIGLIILAIIGMGIYFINKKVIKKDRSKD